MKKQMARIDAKRFTLSRWRAMTPQEKGKTAIAVFALRMLNEVEFADAGDPYQSVMAWRASAGVHGRP